MGTPCSFIPGQAKQRGRLSVQRKARCLVASLEHRLRFGIAFVDVSCSPALSRIYITLNLSVKIWIYIEANSSLPASALRASAGSSPTRLYVACSAVPCEDEQFTQTAPMTHERSKAGMASTARQGRAFRNVERAFG